MEPRARFARSVVMSRSAFSLAPLLALVACSASSSSPSGASDASAADDTGVVDAGTGDTSTDDTTQLPPTSDGAAVEAWLAQGFYKSWACDPMMRTPKPPSGNTMTRICTNAVGAAAGSGEYPVGAAFVEEAGDANGVVTGRAVQRKVASGGAEAIYWYGKFLADSAPLAVGLGSDATVKSQCVDCHSRAGADAGIGHDFVFTQNR
jgi:hypothetical protein